MIHSNKLQERLDAYMEQARANEHKLRQFQDMELRLLSAESLPELCHVLIKEYRQAFALDVVSLLLIDSGDQLGSILESLFQPPSEQDEDDDRDLLEYIQLINDYKRLQDFSAYTEAPVLDTFSSDYKMFFNGHSEGLGSVAILPMHRHGSLIGILCLGSRDPNRYSADMASDFLQRLALMTGVSIENALNIEFLRELSQKDALTSVNNRRYFYQRLEEEVSRGQRQSHAVGCLYMDLDHFKRINDHYGHAAGDMVLIHFTRIVNKIIRNSDVLARLGGEEFAVLLPNISKYRMGEIAERIRMLIESQPCELTPETEIDLTVSIGLAYFDLGEVVGESKQLGELLITQADQALYFAKDNGRNRVCAFEDIENL